MINYTLFAGIFKFSNTKYFIILIRHAISEDFVYISVIKLFKIVRYKSKKTLSTKNCSSIRHEKEEN